MPRAATRPRLTPMVELVGEQRFWSLVARFSGLLPYNHPEFVLCWKWNGRLNVYGYGDLTVTVKRAKPQTLKAHRIAWEVATGVELTQDQQVLHTCDNPACVRNDAAGLYFVNGMPRQRCGHLWLGNRYDNLRDMVAKGRGVGYPDGETADGAKLTRNQALEIILRRAAGEGTKALAAEFNIHRTTVQALVAGRNWPEFAELRATLWRKAS